MLHSELYFVFLASSSQQFGISIIIHNIKLPNEKLQYELQGCNVVSSLLAFKISMYARRYQMQYERIVKRGSKIATLPPMKNDRRSKPIVALVLNPDTRWR